MTQTTNYSLNKPAQEDFYDVADFNQNADIIDNNLTRMEYLRESYRVAQLVFPNEDNSNSVRIVSTGVGVLAVGDPRIASGTADGWMPKGSFNAINALTESVNALEAGMASIGVQQGTVNTQNDLPTTFAGWNSGDYVVVLMDTSDNVPTAKQPAETKYVYNGTALVFSLIIESAGNGFTSSNADGQIFKENDNTGSVNGWDALKSNANAAKNLADQINNQGVLNNAPDIFYNDIDDTTGELVLNFGYTQVDETGEGSAGTYSTTVEIPKGGGGGATGWTPTTYQNTVGNGLQLAIYGQGTADECRLYLRNAAVISSNGQSGIWKYQMRIAPSASINAVSQTFYNYVFAQVMANIPTAVAPPVGRSFDGYVNGCWIPPSNSYAFPFDIRLEVVSGGKLTLRWGIPWTSTGQISPSTPLDFEINLIF
jgi:hypothetical protein